jgi:hypothetical protein
MFTKEKVAVNTYFGPYAGNKIDFNRIDRMDTFYIPTFVYTPIFWNPTRTHS